MRHAYVSYYERAWRYVAHLVSVCKLRIFYHCPLGAEAKTEAELFRCFCEGFVYFFRAFVAAGHCRDD